MEQCQSSVSPAFNLAPKMGHPCSATRTSITVATRQVGKYAVPRQIEPRILELGPGRTMANLLKCPEFLRTCLTPKMSETSLRYRVQVAHEETSIVTVNLK